MRARKCTGARRCRHPYHSSVKAHTGRRHSMPCQALHLHGLWLLLKRFDCLDLWPGKRAVTLRRLGTVRRLVLAWTHVRRRQTAVLFAASAKPNLEGEWTGRIVLALPLAWLVHCLLRCGRRNGCPGAVAGWLSKFLPGDLHFLEYVTLEACPVATGDDVWVGLTPHEDVHPQDLRCRRPNSGPWRCQSIFKLVTR